jgi:hypothetical protein
MLIASALTGNNDINVGLTSGSSAIINILSKLILLLTFGLTYPVLTFALTVTIAIEILLSRLELGYAIQKAIESKSTIIRIYDPEIISLANKRIGNLGWEIVASVYWLIVIVVYSFWSFLFVDMIGNESNNSSDIIIVVFCYVFGSVVIIGMSDYFPLQISQGLIYLQNIFQYSIGFKKEIFDLMRSI